MSQPLINNIMSTNEIRHIIQILESIDQQEASINQISASLVKFISSGKLLVESESVDYDSLSKKFVRYVIRGLKLTDPPRIEFITKQRVDTTQPSFGSFNPNDNSIVVSCLNRHPVDVFRTLAHELIHYKQNMNNELKNDSGSTGSYHENEANAGAGIIMRNFAKKYPGYFE